MKFSDGFWQLRPGVTGLYAQDAYDLIAGGAGFGSSGSSSARGESLIISAPTKAIKARGDVLNLPMLTVTLSSPLPGIIGVTIEHFQGTAAPRGFDLSGAEAGHGTVLLTENEGVLTSGGLSARVSRGAPWDLSFNFGENVLTSSGHKSIGYMDVAPGADVPSGVGSAEPGPYVHGQLSLGIGELVYGLGERFGALVKNGQSIDVWNADGGTSSDQAYKNVPFYLTNRGYGVLVNDPGLVSYEVGSDSVERVQFSVSGERLEYFVILGPTPKQILERYTALTGRPATVPAWSYGLWLSTSFTTNYDEATVCSFIDAMAERDLPLSVFHFDCFWMREFNWTDLKWDARTFPDPEGMLARLHQKDLHICVWINPYIAQRSALFAEAAAAGYLVRRPNGDVWQWDMWQAGMALVDFTNPEATSWFQGKLRRLLDQGVDAFKTDFGERIPLEVEWFDGSDPQRMHNYYTQLYNKAVFDVLEEHRGPGDAVLFARSATVGGQSLPVHWGGDSTSTYESMAETLRGGLSLAFSGFAFWSHDIGGFEGLPDAGVFKRWTAFGLLSSHSRFHGSNSYRVPWIFDKLPDGTEDTGPQSAVAVTRTFTKLKLTLMPYLYAAGLAASATGVPLLRPMQLEFADDPATGYLDRQYMLGGDILVAPVFNAAGTAEFYLPAGMWTNYFTEETVTGPCWRRETHGFNSIPLYVRDGAVLTIGSRDDRPDYDYLDELELVVYPSSAGSTTTVTVTTPEGDSAGFVVMRDAGRVTVTSPSPRPWSVRIAGRAGAVAAIDGVVTLEAEVEK